MSPTAQIIGAAMTAMNRRDLGAEELTQQVVTDVLADAGIGPEQIGLVVFANATAGRLLDQGCIRGQSFLGSGGQFHTGVVNVDNSCAGGASALHLATLAAAGSTRPVLVLGVEKMWTGDRSATLAGIEDGVPLVDRQALHRDLENPSGSVLMALNARWAAESIEVRRATVEQMASAAVKSRAHGSLNPKAQYQSRVTLQEVLDSATIVPPLTRLMCSSFTDGAAALVISGMPAAGAPRIRSSTARSGAGQMDYHDRLEEAAAVAWEESGVDPSEIDVVELHDATSAEEILALESLGLFKPGDAGPATLAGETSIGGKGVTVNPSGGLVSRGHPLGATGIAQVVELVAHLRGDAGPRQVEGARLAVAANTGGMIGSDGGTTDAAFIGIHVLEAG